MVTAPQTRQTGLCNSASLKPVLTIPTLNSTTWCRWYLPDPRNSWQVNFLWLQNYNSRFGVTATTQPRAIWFSQVAPTHPPTHPAPGNSVFSVCKFLHTPTKGTDMVLWLRAVQFQPCANFIWFNTPLTRRRGNLSPTAETRNSIFSGTETTLDTSNLTIRTAQSSNFRCRSHLKHIRQPRSDSGLGFQVKGLIFLEVFPLCSEVGGA